MERGAGRARDGFSYAAYFAFFFVSGFCGLVYQVVWVRMAFARFGIIPPVLSVVVSVFMLGLGLGSWASARLADAWLARRGRTALELYALAEASVAAFAWTVPLLFAASGRLLLSLGDMDSFSYLAASGLLLGAAIFPACACMGATIPIMMRHIAPAGEDRRAFSFLYLANVLGALCGTILTAAVLIEAFGFRGTQRLAVGLNLLIAAAAALAARLQAKPSGARPPQAAAAVLPAARSRGNLLILFSTGLASMGCEVLWTRGLTPILGTSVYSFAFVLGAFLLWTGLGSFAYRWDARSGRVSRVSTQALLIGAASAFFLPVLWNDPRWQEVGLEAALSMGPFCALLGYLTPRLVDEYSGGEARAAGRAYAVNIAGCVVGPLIASYLLLPNVGSRIGAVILSLFFLPPLALGTRGRLRFGLAAIALPLFAAVFFTRSYEENPPGTGPPREMRRDYAATVIATGTGARRRLAVNGIGMTALHPVTKMMAHLPIVAHEGRPRRALLICFGMGTTYRSLLSWGIPTTAVELIPSVPKSLAFFHQDARAVLSDPLGTVVIDDSRRYLSRTKDRYDIITLDPPPPTEAAGSSLLYSSEFYDLARRRLNPGGILQQWWPAGELKILEAVTLTLHEAFPYVRIFKGNGDIGFHFLASESPIKLRAPTARLADLPAAARRDLREWLPEADSRRKAIPLADHEIPLAGFLTPEAAAPLITDDRPFNEYYLMRRWSAHSIVLVK